MIRRARVHQNISKQRMHAVSAALGIERAAFNAQITAGARPVLDTAFGPHVVAAVSPQHEYLTYPVGHFREWLHQRTFSGCNDSTWSALLSLVGVTRHPLFAAFTYTPEEPSHE